MRSWASTTSVALGVFSAVALFASLANAEETLTNWLAMGGRNAPCGSAAPEVTCNQALGLECIRNRCELSRRAGDAGCPIGASDCNVCVHNVRQEFDALFSQGSWQRGKWRYTSLSTRYPPSNLTPEHAYDDGSWEDFFDIQRSHVQGFVRTNAVYTPFAITHSDDKDGTLSLIGMTTAPTTYRLSALHRTNSNHPSGMFSLGKYVGFTDGSSILRLIDVNRSMQSHDISYTLPKKIISPPVPLPSNEIPIPCDGEQAAWGYCQPPPPPPTAITYAVGTAGGGIAMTKLKSGAYLLVGARGNEEGGDHFVLMEGSIEQPRRKEHLGFIPYAGPQDFIGSENLSLVTECGTGDIYAIHVYGTDSVDFIFDTDGDSYYRLSKLEWNNGSDLPVLRYQTAHTFGQSDDDCWTRGAGSIYVNPGTRRLEAYCHGRDHDTDGTSNGFEFKYLTRPFIVEPPGPCPPSEVCIDLCGEPPLPPCLF